LLRTIATNHRSSNGLHGGTSISWTSPPFTNIILSSLPLPCQGEIRRALGKTTLRSLDYTDSEKKDYTDFSFLNAFLIGVIVP
jgi:hypothetical protein